MSHYEIAVRLWSAVAAAALLLPFVALAVHETRKAVECLRADARADSVPSRPAPSTPSHPGY